MLTICCPKGFTFKGFYTRPKERSQLQQEKIQQIREERESVSLKVQRFFVLLSTSSLNAPEVAKEIIRDCFKFIISPTEIKIEMNNKKIEEYQQEIMKRFNPATRETLVLTLKNLIPELLEMELENEADQALSIGIIRKPISKKMLFGLAEKFSHPSWFMPPI